MRHRSNVHAASVTAKGRAARGAEFRAAVMRSDHEDDANRLAVFISVMATEGDTVVRFDEIKPGVVFNGTETELVGGKETTKPFSTTLMRHESLIIGVAQNDSFNWDDVNGTRVRSVVVTGSGDGFRADPTKPIVVMSGAWTGGAQATGGTNADIGVDQLTPVELAGSEYVVTKGDGAIDARMEAPLVIGLAPETSLEVNGHTKYCADPSSVGFNGPDCETDAECSGTDTCRELLLGTGEYVYLQGLFTRNGRDCDQAHCNMFVEAFRHETRPREPVPVVVVQTLLGAEGAKQTGGFNFIPPFTEEGKGQFDVVIPDVEWLAEGGTRRPRLGIVARSDPGTTILVNDVDIIGAGADVLLVPGRPDWATYSLDLTARLVNASGHSEVVIDPGPTAVTMHGRKSRSGAAAYYAGFPAVAPPGCGNGIVEPREECDDGNTVDGDCCSSSCTLDARGAPCSDGVFCTAGDECDGAGNCIPGGPNDCDDGVGCTVDSCDDANDECLNTPDDGVCDNGLFCDGQETCDPLDDCTDGAPIDCDDGVGCTADSCDDTNDECLNTPDDGTCDNGLFCDGQETCDPLDDCAAGTPLDCDDDDVCTIDSCNESADTCENLFDSGLPGCADPVCGNGVLEAGEECDDGNNLDGDGCDAFCFIEQDDEDEDGDEASDELL